MKDKIKLGIAWTFLVGGIIGFVLSALRIIAKEEPLIVLLLSWSALIYEGFNGVMIAGDNKKNGSQHPDRCPRCDYSFCD